MFQVLQKKECIFLSTLFWYILKTSFIVYFIFFFSLTGISQTYEKLYKTQFDDISEDAIELPDKSIIISVTSGDFYQANYQAYLYKLSYAGLLIDSTEINIPEYYNLKGIDNIFKISDTSLLTLCICQNIFNDSLYVLITQFNFELKTLFSSLTNFSVPFNYSFTNHILNSENNLVSIGTEYSNYDHFIYEYDINGNLINHNLVIDPAIQTIASAIMDIENLGKYHLFLFFHPQDFLIINKETLEIDTILDYPSTFSPWDIHSSLNDSTYLTIGRNYIGNGIKVPAFLEMDNMGNVLNMHSYTANPDTNSGNIDKSLDIFNDKIFLVAAYNFLVNASYPFVQQQQWIWLNRINQDFSVSWQRFYKGEVNYMPYKILATSDGGALILSTKYDWNDSIPFQRDVHILKVDSTGWYEGLQTGTTEFDKPKQILVYPNPVKDKVKFVLGLYDNLELSIYNSNGQRVIRQKLPYSQTLNMSHFPKGLYVYILRGKNGFIEKGKFIKH